MTQANNANEKNSARMSMIMFCFQLNKIFSEPVLPDTLLGDPVYVKKDVLFCFTNLNIFIP